MMATTTAGSEQSKLLYGNSHMLDVMLAITSSPNGQFSAPELIRTVGITPNLVYSVLGRLTRLDAIEIIGTVPGERTALYKRKDHPAFHNVHDIAAITKHAGSRDAA